MFILSIKDLKDGFLGQPLAVKAVLVLGVVAVLAFVLPLVLIPVIVMWQLGFFNF